MIAETKAIIKGMKSTGSRTEAGGKTMKKANNNIWWMILGVVLSLSGPTGLAWALDDDVPFFAGTLGMPNVLIIFDNSDSMQDVPYVRAGGNPLRPGADEEWEWRRGVKDADNDGVIDEDSSGNIDWNEYAHVSQDTVSVPGTIPPPIPGIGSLTSNVTSLDNPLAVYDSAVDWTDSGMTDDSEFNNAYRYHVLQVEDANGAKQYRTIEGRDTALGCWYFFPTGEGFPERPLDFGNPPYTYTILSGLPGDVTWTESWGEGNIVRDANIDWSDMEEDTFDDQYRDHILVVTAGTNAEESRRISGWSRHGKNWIVETGFAQSCDRTTQYKIIGSPEADERFASGGSHPASKLYQAKKALFAFLESDAIRTCDRGDGNGNCVEWRYLMNMGFATFLSARIPQVRARYYRKRVDGETFWYETEERDTQGNYGVSNPSNPEYINPTSLEVTPYRGFEGESLTPKGCPDPNPPEGEGDYTLVTEANAMYHVPVDSLGTLGDIVPNTYNNTYFVYPGMGTSTRPHAWSYRRTSHPYIYRQGTSTSGQSNWNEGIQNNPLFPAIVGDEMANHTGDDQVVFVNLPEYDDADEHKGDDVTGSNITKILHYISLARVQRPGEGYEDHDMTIMPYTHSIPPNETEEGTPLAASLENAREYYESYFAQDQFTQGDCRSNYVILVTDGLEACDGDPVAAAAHLNTNLIPGNPSSAVKTFVVGLGLDNVSKAGVNAIASAGGTDQAYFPTDVDELLDVLADQITSQIIGDSYSRSSPVIALYRDDSDALKLYYSYFDYPVWRGHLEAYTLNQDGSRGELVADWTSDCDSDTGNDGDAGCEMKIQGRGTVYTVADPTDMTRIEFTPGNVETLAPVVNPEGQDIDGNGVAGEEADAVAVIGYTLSPGYDDLNYVGSRDGGWPLGDIYHSLPVVVTGPRLSIPYWAGYNDFKSSHAGRPTMIYVGANDGMLHAIRDVDGREEWAYIPNSVLGRLHGFKDGHRFTVDLSIKGADVDTSEGCDGSGWRTVVVSGLRRGGSSYYALDVTDPTNPLPMWEMTDYTDDNDSSNDNMGNTWSAPSFGRLNVNGATTTVIIVGGGLSEEESRGNRIYMLRADDGSILREIPVGSSANNVPSEIKTVRYLLDFDGRPLDHITRAPVDSSLKGHIEVAYFGGTDGTLYKLTGLNADSGWNPQVEVLYRPPPEEARPIYHRPEVADYLSCKKRYILFGTGDESSPGTVAQNYVYEIEDRAWDEEGDGEDYPDGSQGKNNGLFRMTWKKTLAFGEAVLSDPVFYIDTLYFTTYQPQGGCDMGLSYLYGLTTSTCRTTGREPGLQYSLSGSPLSTPEEKQKLGKGIATSPVVTPPKMFIGLGDRVMEVPVPEDVPLLQYWREDG